MGMDRETGNSRGFAFVEYGDVESAKEGHKKMLGKELDGRAVNVIYATPKEDMPSGGGGRGGGRGRGGDRGGRGRGGRGGRGNGRGGAIAANKGTIQNFEGSKLTFDNDSD